MIDDTVQLSKTIGEAVANATRRLVAAGVDAPRLDARLLVGRVLGVGQETIVGYPERMLDAGQAVRLEALVARRQRREPMARILGEREFWSLSIGVDEHTLIPRPDSETLVEAALATFADRAAPLRILDLGTGSGCLLLALLSELPRAVGVGTDCNGGAVRAATRNAVNLGLAGRAEFVVTNWADGIEGRFDLVISNPPYIVDAEIAALAPDVREFEPRLALAGGPDGLDAYRVVAACLAGVLAPQAIFVLEIGFDQATPVVRILQENGFEPVEVKEDLSGNPRCVVGRIVDAPTR